MEERHVPVILHSPPGDAETPPASGFIADTPENRAALEAAAIPRCREWREANPEPRFWCDDEPGNEWCASNHAHPSRVERAAPYCCSAYCDRCAGLRALNGDDPALRPNEWMER